MTQETVSVAVSLTGDYCQDIYLIHNFITPYFDKEGMKVFRCRSISCKKPLGHTDGYRLYMAGCVFSWPTQLQCVHCGSLTKWRPVIKPVTKVTMSNT